MFRGIFCQYEEDLNEVDIFDFTTQAELQNLLTKSTTLLANDQSKDPNQQNQHSVEVPVLCEFLHSEETGKFVKDISSIGIIEEKGLPSFDPLVYLSDFDTPIQNIAQSEKVVSAKVYFSASSIGAGLEHEEGGEKMARDSYRPLGLSASSHSDISPGEGERESEHVPRSFEAPNYHQFLHRYSITEGADANTNVVNLKVPSVVQSLQSIECLANSHHLQASTESVVLGGRSSKTVDAVLLGVNLPTASSACESLAYLRSVSKGESQESFLSTADRLDHSNAVGTTALWQPLHSGRTEGALYVKLEELLNAGHYIDSEAVWTEDQSERILESMLRDLEDTIRGQPQRAICSMATNEDDLESLIVDHPLFPHIVMASLSSYKTGADDDEEKVLDGLASLHFPQLDAPEKNSEDRRSSQGRDPRLDLCLGKYLHLVRQFKLDIENVLTSAATFCEQMKQKILIECPELGDSLARKQSESCSVSCGSPDACLSQDELEDMIHEDHAQANDSAISPASTSKPQVLSDEQWRGAILATYDQKLLKNLQRKHLKEGRKNAKLPDPARRLLMGWWKEHTGNPYPSEDEKHLLAKDTGLEIEQINNWFINQRKRHCCAAFSDNHKSHTPNCYKVTAPRR